MARHEDAPTTGTGVTRYVVAALVLGVLALVLAIRNSDRAEVDLLVWSGRAPVYAVAFVALLLGAALTSLLTAVWRHRRIRLNRERRAAAEAPALDLRSDPAPRTGQEPAPSWTDSPPSP
jgi:uncharacterized integral membrane protein